MEPHGTVAPQSLAGVLYEENSPPFHLKESISLLEGQTIRKEYVGSWPRHIQKGLVPSYQRKVMLLNQAGVLGDEGWIYCRRTRSLIRESAELWSTSASNNPILGTVRGFEPRRLEGLSLMLSARGSSGFYHFLIETLPKWKLLKEWAGDANHILVPGCSGSFHAAWLQHAGIPMDKCIFLNGCSHLHCDQLAYSSATMGDQMPDEWTILTLRDMFHQPTKTAGRFLWISRKNASARHLSWENKLLSKLPSFEMIDTCKITPPEQIAAVVSASAIVAPHGAGLALAAFLNPFARVVELFPDQSFQHPLYARLCHAAGVEHRWASLPFEKEPEHLEDITEKIESFIEARPAL